MTSDPMGPAAPMGPHADGKPAGKGGCTGKSKRTGLRCDAWVIKGTDKCPAHAGKSRSKAIAEGAVRTDLLRWIPGTPLVDPAEQYLRLITQSAHRAQQLSVELEGIVAASGSLQKALTADSYAATENGGSVKTGEYVRALTQLEMSERKFCADMCAKAIAAGLEDRRVRVAEQTGALLAGVVQAILGDLGLSAEQQQLVPTVVPARFREILGSAA